MLSPGEAVIPAKIAKKYAPFIQDMIAGNIPGFMSGVFLGMPKSAKSVSKGRTAADEVYELFKKSSYANTPPTEYGHQISPTSGHSFPIFGLGGVYQKGPKQVFVKPVMDETAALAEMRATAIARQAHGLKAPEQRVVVIRDPMDIKRERKFLALESDLDPTFINTQPMGVFNEEQYFRQLAASLLRADKDLSASNVYGDVVADVGPAGVFDRASGLRQYSSNLPSMEDQALINLLGIKGGAKRAFAESTLGLMAGLTPEQYHQRMIAEIQRVLPKLRETIASFKLTNPVDVGMYDDMVRRLEAGLAVDWRKFHTLHSNVQIAKPKVPRVKKPAGYASGVVSVPGPKGAGDVVPAMLSPGEAVIPAAMAEKYGPLISSMVSGNIPGYNEGYDPNNDPFRTPSFDANPFGVSSEDGISPNKKDFKQIFKDGAKQLGDGLLENAKIAGTTVADKVSDGLAAAWARSKLGKAQAGDREVVNERTGNTVYNPKTDPNSKYYVGPKSENPAKSQPASTNTAAAGTGGQDADGVNRPLTEKEQIQKFGGKLAQTGMIASMVTSAASMIPGVVGETAQQLAGPIMAMTTLASFIQGPLSGAFVAVIAVIGAMTMAILKVNDAYRNAQTEAIRLQKSIGASTESIRKLGEFAGNVTAGEKAEKRRENRFRLMEVAPGKTTFGESYIQDEAGQELLKDLKTEVANSGGDTASALKAVSSQLSMSVVSGALSADQAGSIASEIGLQLNDASFGIKVRGEITELIGPNGEDLKNNELVVATRLAATSIDNMEQSKEAMNAQLANSRSSPLSVGNIVGAGLDTELGRGTAAGGTVLAMAGAGAAIGSIIPGLGTAVGLVAGTLVGAVAGYFTATSLLEEAAKKVGAASGAFVADLTTAVQQQNEIKAVLDETYAKKMDEAAAEGDIAEYKRLQLEYDEKRLGLTQTAASLNEDIINTVNEMDAGGQEAVITGLKNAANIKYKDDVNAATYMPVIDNQIKSANLDKGQEAMIRTQILSDLPLDALSRLLTVGDVEKVVNIIGNLGGPMATEAMMVANMIKDDDLSAKFLLDVEATGTDSVEAQRLIDLATNVAALGGSGVMENSIKTVFTTLVDDTANSEAITAIMGGLDERKVETVEQVYEVVPEFTVDGKYADAFNEEYFATLQSNAQKETYVLVSRMIMQIPEATFIASADFKNWLGDEGAKYGAFPGENSYAWWQQTYADSMAQKVTTSGVVLSGQGAPVEEENTGGGGGPAASPLDDMLKKLRDLRKSQIGVTKGFDASSAAIDKLFGGNKGITVFDGLEQSMRRLGAGEDLISAIAGMDPEEFDKRKNQLFNFDKQTGAIIGFKNKLINIGEALSSIAVGEYVNDQQKAAQEAKNQVGAFNELRAAGYSVAEAYEAVQDASLAAALVSGNVTAGEVQEMLETRKRFLEEQKKLARLTPEGLEEVFTEGFNKAMEAFDAQEKKLTLEFDLKVADDKAAITAAENEIAKIRYEIDDYEASLRGIEDQEKAINKTYDEKLEALEKVRQANQKVLDQEKGKLSVAEAISRGDLAATARAAQDLRATSASGYFSSQTDALNAGRQSALDQVRGADGLSRVELEEKIKNLTDEIFAIEEKTLEPAQERIRLAQVELDKRIEELEVLGKTKTEWETIKNSIDLARTNSAGYLAAMTEAEKEVQNIKDLWNEIEKPKETVYTVKTVKEGDTTPAGPAGPAAPAAAKPPGPPKPNGGKPVVTPGGGSLLGTNWIAMASGGKVMSYMSDGGSPLGSDTVSAMLTPGEFVVKRPMVNKYGTALLESINSGSLQIPSGPRFSTPSDLGISKGPVRLPDKQAPANNNSSVYNYNLSVNVASQSDPNTIAQTVMAQLQRVESQRVRNGRF